MKGIIYCRVSSHDQVQGTSLENQRTACLQYAQNRGIEVKEIFIEEGESATAANRTQFLNALDYCRDNKDIEAFIVWKIDRFARNTTDHFSVRAKLVGYNTTLHSVTEPITDDPQGQLMETMLAGFAQFENEIRKQRCTSGMQGSLRKGLFIWSPKFGYKRIHKKVRRVTEPDTIDEPTASLLRKGMLLYAEGNTSISELARLSKKWGLRTRTNIPLYKQRWSELLKDKFYAGYIYDPWSGEYHQGLHEPLISLETFHKIQMVKNKYARNSEARTKINTDFPLRGFVRCSCCNTSLTGSYSKGRNGYHGYYHCKKKGCDVYGQSIRKADLEGKFVQLLQTYTPKEEYIKLFEASVLKVWHQRKAEAVETKDNFSEHITNLQARLDRIVEMRADGEIDKETFKKMRSDIESKIATFKTSESEAEILLLDLEAKIKYSMQNIRNIARVWQDVDVYKKIKLQNAVLPEGVTYDKGSGLFGTAPLSYIFRLFWDFPMEESALVAGPGIEPGSGGYEPPEVPLLYPAIYVYTFTNI
jgi:site-specific DNA recombinase